MNIIQCSPPDKTGTERQIFSSVCHQNTFKQTSVPQLPYLQRVKEYLFPKFSIWDQEICSRFSSVSFYILGSFDLKAQKYAKPHDI